MELYIEPHRPERNPLNGRYNKGYTPYNKGRKRSEWATKEHEQNLRQAVKNNPNRHVVAGWNKRAVIMIDKDGRHAWFESSEKASRVTGVNGANIRQVCNKHHNHAGGYKWFWFDDEEWVKLVNGEK